MPLPEPAAQEHRKQARQAREAVIRLAMVRCMPGCQINRLDFSVCFNLPIAGLASETVHIEIEAEAVLRKEQ